MAIATPYMWVLEKGIIGAPLRKILIPWRPQNINTMPFTFQMSYFIEGFKNEPFPLLYPDFNAWKKVGSYSAVQDNTVMQLLPTFFQTLNSGYMGENRLFLTPSKSLTLLGNDSF